MPLLILPRWIPWPSLSAIIDGLPAGLPSLLTKSILIWNGGRWDMPRRSDENWDWPDRNNSESALAKPLAVPDLSCHNRTGLTDRTNVHYPLENYDSIKIITGPARTRRLCGLMKYARKDIRISWKSQCRETTMRVAIGSVAKAFLAELGIQLWGILSHRLH